MKYQKEIVTHLDRIANALEKIVKHVDKAGGDDKPAQEVQVDDSMGACPNCESTEVQQQGRWPAAIYHCTRCEHLWVNDANAFFEK